MTLQLSTLYSDGIIFQRNEKIVVLGKGKANKRVTLIFVERKYTTVAQEDGSWQIEIEKCSHGGPFAMEIFSEDEKIMIKDILIGDVWLCGGQSNMEMLMNRVKHMYPECFNEKTIPLIRQFKVPQETDFREAREMLTQGKWETLSPETIENFSAIGYFFACYLYEKYGVPIGLIASAVGGTPIHAWMGREMLEDFPLEIEEATKLAQQAYIVSVQEAEKQRTEEYFKRLDNNDIGLLEGWENPKFDDTSWFERDLTIPWDSELQEPGAVWFRKDIEIPEKFCGKPATLFLGTIADADTVYLNGGTIGNTTYRYPPREYKIESLPKGTCTLAIRVINQYGTGGFMPGKPRMLVSSGFTIDLNGKWKFKRASKMETFLQETAFHYKPTGLYNGMISPLTKFPIKGVIWYQGESDTGNYEKYDVKFAAMVKGWRRNWGIEFPFISTQLTHYAYTNGVDWDLLRGKQLSSLKVPNTGMVYTEDVGEYNDLHPMNKKSIAERLARVALRIAYNENLPDSPFEVCGLME